MTDMIKSLYNIFVLFILSVTLLAGCGGDGGAASGTNGDPTPQGSAPSPPSGVAAIAGISKVTISWDELPDATSYNIYWSASSGVGKSNGKKISDAASPYNHIGLTDGTTYYYVVTAVNSHGESSESNQAAATPQASGSPPSAPLGIYAAAVGNQININWNNVANATSYNLYWSTAPGVDKTSPNKIGVGNVISYAHTNLTPGTTYYYVITAVNDYGESAGSYPAVSATISDSGMLQGYIKDASTRAPLQGVAVSIFDSYSTITASRGTNAFGGYTATLTMGTYSMSIYKTGYIPENISNIRIQGNVVTTLETILQVSEPAPGVPVTGTVTGTILDSFDAKVVSGVTLNFRDGINTTTGDTVATTTTNDSGVYTVPDLPAGNYTAEAIVSGADPAYFTVTVIGGQTNEHQDATITPNLDATAIRIVLTWSSGLDLDSHLTGPILDDRFHVYWNNIGSSTSSPYAKLDIDDKDYGPETITIYKQYDGVYRYSVHNYSNINVPESTGLSNSSAQVKVYMGSSLLETFNVPVINEGANLWTVFEMSGDTITPLNTMRYENNSLSVQ